jgi:glycolate oxidase
LQAIAGREHVLWRPDQLRSYEYDGSVDVGHPDAVVLVSSRDEVVQVVRVARKYGKPVVPRGAGTGLSGGALLTRGGIAIGFSLMRRIIEIDPLNLRAVCEPGVVNLDLTRAAAAHGLYYAPDPSSQAACTLGGNVAENSGGAHCLAYGVTTNHVLGLELVLADGEVVAVGDLAPDRPGYDLTGLVVGSEGTFAIVTKISLRLMPIHEAVRTLLAVFPSVGAACAATSAIIAAGLIPAALEMMDGLTLQALTKAGHKGLPAGAGAALLVELEGLEEGLADQVPVVERICLDQGAVSVRAAQSSEERDRLWKARKGALGALGQLKPNYYLQDGVIPRTRLVEVLQTVADVSERYGLPIANVFHAGDGNLHPCIVFDQRVPGETEKVVAAGAEILRKCVDIGGTLSGEHGIGIEKQAYMPWVFSDADFAAMRAVKHVFDPGDLLNPGKILPE